MMTGKKILVFIAHPDDETRCSGTLAKLASNGNSVYLVLATNGNKGTHSVDVKPSDIAAIRKREMEEAVQVLQASGIIWLGFDNGKLYNAPDLKEKVFKTIREYKPDIVITFDPWKSYDLHSDHRAIGFAASEAAYLADACWYFPEHTLEGVDAHKTTELYLFNPEQPNYSVDIKDFLPLKAAAAEKHVSQFGNISFTEKELKWIERCGGQRDDLYREQFRKVFYSDLEI